MAFCEPKKEPERNAAGNSIRATFDWPKTKDVIDVNGLGMGYAHPSDPMGLNIPNYEATTPDRITELEKRVKNLESDMGFRLDEVQRQVRALMRWAIAKDQTSSIKEYPRERDSLSDEECKAELRDRFKKLQVL